MALRGHATWGPGECTFCYVRFSEQFVKGSDAILVICLLYMTIIEIFEYKNYEQALCEKPFGIFWIGDFISIVVFRVFHYVERHFATVGQIARLRNQQSQRRKANRCYKFAWVIKNLVYLVFFAWTIVGTVWFIQDNGCLENLEDHTDSSFGRNAKRTLALWLFISFCVCVLYGYRLLLRAINPEPPLTQAALNGIALGNARIHPGVGNFSMFLWTDAQMARRNGGGRRLEDREINALKPIKCTSIEQTRRKKIASPAPDDEILPPPPPLEKESDETDAKKASGTRVYLDAVDPELPQPEHSCGDSNEASTCAVCLDSIEINQWFKKLPQCEHAFHVACIDEWLSTRATCPVCREEVHVSESLLLNAHPASPNKDAPPLEEDYPPPFVTSRPPQEEDAPRPHLVLRFERSMPRGV